MRFIIFAILLFACLSAAIASCILESAVSANPIGPPTPPPPTESSYRVTDLATGIPWLVAMNFFVNLLLISLFLILVGWGLKHRLDVAQKSRRSLILSLLVLAAVVTLVGAFVDYFLVLETDPEAGTDDRIIQFGAVEWIVAVIIILVSIVVPSVFMLHLSIKPSLLLGAMIAAVNPVFWTLTYQLGINFAYMLAILSVLLAPIAVIMLWDYNKKLEVKPTAPRPGGA